MGFIPKALVELGTKRRFTLVETGEFKETEYDQLIVANADLLGELLLKAGAIDEGSELKVLGTQIPTSAGRIDVLLAEVSAVAKEFRRLVLVENKLLRNPEAKRTVVGQILDYAGALQREGEELLENLSERASGEVKEWLERSSEAILHSLSANDYVLVVSGDDIHPNLQRIVRGFARNAGQDPLMVADLCLVSWAVFADPEGKQRIVVPHLIGGVIGAEREVTIRVQVGAEGGTVPAKVTALQDEGPGSASEEEFFGAKWIPKFGKESVDEWHALAKTLLEAGIPGLELDHIKSGRPRFVLSDAAHPEPLPVLRPRTSAREFRDMIDHKAWVTSPKMLAAGETFRKTLLQLKGAKTQSKGHVHIPMASAKAQSDMIVGALRLLSQAFQE